MSVADHVNLVRLDHPLGRHIGVFGAGGKSTLARAIAQKHDLAFIELDTIQHMPGWRRRPDEEVMKIVLERMEASPQGWVTDHNSQSVRQMIMERVESVIVLELPFRTIFSRRVKRSIRRAWTKELVCGGNTETFRQHFASGESAILEMWKLRKAYSRIGETISRGARSGVDFFHIRTTRQLNRFYEIHDLSRNAPNRVYG